MNFSSYPTNEFIEKHKLNTHPTNPIEFAHSGMDYQYHLLSILSNILTRIEALEKLNVDKDRG